MKKLKKTDYTLLFELMKNSKISDRHLAEELGVSQPTITRRRAALEKMRLLNYTSIPDFKALGFKILTFNFIQYNHEVRSPSRKQQLAEMIETHLKKHPCIIFGSSGDGLGFDGISVSLHKDYADLREFIGSLKEEWADWVTNVNSFIVSLESDNIIRSFTFKHLIESLKI